MALFGEVNVPAPVLEDTVVIETAVVVDRDTAISKLVQYIDGEDWTIESYYTTLVRRNDLVEYIDTDKNANENQYVEIKGLNLKVSSPLTTANINVLNGSSTITVKIIPSKGDMFTARIVSGELGLFVVTNVEEKSYKLDRMFSIDYVLDTTNIISSTKLEEVRNRVVKTFIYREEMVLNDSNPLLLESDDAFYRDLSKTFTSLSDFYYRKFIHDSGYLLLTKDGIGNILDPYITYLFSTLRGDTDENIFTYVDISEELKSPISQFLEDVSSISDFKGYYQSNSPASYFQEARARGHLPLAITKFVTLKDTGEQFVLDSDNENLPNRDFIDNTYLFSKDGTSPLEIVVTNAILGDSVDRETITSLAKDVPNWTDEEHYWFLPLLLFVIKNEEYKINSFY